MGVAAGDYDNDGFVDLYVAGVNHNQLFHNNGDGTFTDVTAKAGVAVKLPIMARPGQLQLDGLTTTMTACLIYSSSTTSITILRLQPSATWRESPTYCSPNGFRGTPNILYRNNGDGTFTDVSEPSHISRYAGKGMGVAFADYDNNGLTDIFVSNDTFPNYLLHNNGDGTFTDVAIVSGVAYTENGKVVAGMGADFRDLDNDGKPDIFHTAMFGDIFPLYRNLGRGQFEDATVEAGLPLYKPADSLGNRRF